MLTVLADWLHTNNTKGFSCFYEDILDLAHGNPSFFFFSSPFFVSSLSFFLSFFLSSLFLSLLPISFMAFSPDVGFVVRKVFNDPSRVEKEPSLFVWSLRRLSQHFACVQSWQPSCLPLQCPSHAANPFVLEVSAAARCECLQEALTKLLGLWITKVPMDLVGKLYALLFSQVQSASPQIKLVCLYVGCLYSFAFSVLHFPPPSYRCLYQR